MLTEEIFSQLVAHMKKGVLIHNQMTSLFGFLNLKKYQKRQEKQFYEENKNCRELQDYYLNRYQKLLPELPVENPALIPQNWVKYTKSEVDTNTRRSMTKDLFKKWIEWETQTKEKFQKAYKDLFENGDIDATYKIGELIQDVENELQFARELKIKLDATRRWSHRPGGWPPRWRGSRSAEWWPRRQRCRCPGPRWACA